MARRSFTVPAPTDTVEFDLEGQTFRCRPRVAAGILMRFAEIIGADEDEDSVSAQDIIRMMREFFEAAVVRDDFERFWALIEDPDTAIPVEMLADIANWLAEQYTQRPTGAPSSGGRANGSSGDALTGVVYTRESTSPPLTAIEPSTS